MYIGDQAFYEKNEINQFPQQPEHEEKTKEKNNNIIPNPMGKELNMFIFLEVWKDKCNLSVYGIWSVRSPDLKWIVKEKNTPGKIEQETDWNETETVRLVKKYTIFSSSIASLWRILASDSILYHFCCVLFSFHTVRLDSNIDCHWIWFHLNMVFPSPGHHTIAKSLCWASFDSMLN